jgi:hypothetical protein
VIRYLNVWLLRITRACIPRSVCPTNFISNGGSHTIPAGRNPLAMFSSALALVLAVVFMLMRRAPTCNKAREELPGKARCLSNACQKL